jgi:hypothetical protein
MINWNKTHKKFGYASLVDLKGIKRPLVVCECITCKKEKDIQLRLKQDITWTCPTCVSLSRGDKISRHLKTKWQDEAYRSHQLAQKSQTDYKKNQSSLSIERWQNEAYSSKLRTGIDHQKFKEDNFQILEATDWQHKITVKCKTCGYINSLTPQKHFENQYCPKCHISKGQREISDWLTSLEISHTINDWNILKYKELDIFIPSHNIAIEYHGLYWHSESSNGSKETKDCHQSKALACKEKGIRLYQIFEHEWLEKKDLIKSMILLNISSPQRIDARKTTFKKLQNYEAKLFFTKNHLQGHRNAKHIYGLTYEKELVIAISFNEIKKGEYEIIRLASQQGHIVRGGASKLIANFDKIFDHPTIHTFADLRHSHGTVYKALGFQELEVTSPGYFYYHPNGNTILSRQQCQKHKLHKLLKSFNHNVSESQNMFINGYRRVWTAGNIKFIRPKSISS